MLEAWNVKPRGYVTSAVESGNLSARSAMIGLSTYFYLTHGVRTIDIVWHAREKFTPKWGIYEVGVLSPLLRVFFPGNQQVEAMEAELRAAMIYGFFPTVWGAAFIDFGLVGAIIYILDLGCRGGLERGGKQTLRPDDAVAAPGLCARQHPAQLGAGAAGHGKFGAGAGFAGPDRSHA